MRKLFKLTLLDKFIYRQVIEFFLLGIIVFTSIIFASDTFISLIKQISEFGMPFKIALMIILLNLPSVIVMTIPISVLFATVMTVNKMCLQSEITVLKACGISIQRIAKPIFIFATIMAMFNFFIRETIVPVTTSQSKTLALYAILQRNIPEKKRNFTIKEMKDGIHLKRLFYVENCEDKQFTNVSVIDLSEEDNIRILQAKTGTSVIEGWQFNNASVYTIYKTEQSLNTSWIEKTIIDFGSDIQQQLDKKNDGSEYNFIQLFKYLKDKGQNLTDDVRLKYSVAFWDKFSFPITTVVFVLLGIPLAITPPRVRHNRGFLFTIGVIFIYYVINAFSVSLGYNKTVPPVIAANLPNIIIGITGCFYFIRKCYKI